MSEPTTQEPTMEEILASIRRIISEDDAPAAEPATAADAAPAGGGDDVLELTDRMEEPKPAPQPPARGASGPEAAPKAVSESAPPPQTVGDLDVFAPPPAPQPTAQSSPAPRPLDPELSSPPASTPAPWGAAGHEVDEDEPLVADHRADAAASHFGALAQSLAMPAPGRTLEDVVRELLRPLLKDWLEQNLPQIVEARVQAEVERISRRRVS